MRVSHAHDHSTTILVSSDDTYINTPPCPHPRFTAPVFHTPAQRRPTTRAGTRSTHAAVMEVEAGERARLRSSRQACGRGSCCIEGTLDGSPRDGEWGPSSLGSRPRCASSIFGIEPPPHGRAIVKSCPMLCCCCCDGGGYRCPASPCARPLSRSRADTHFTSNSNARPPAYLSHGAVLAVVADDVLLPYCLNLSLNLNIPSHYQIPQPPSLAPCLHKRNNERTRSSKTSDCPPPPPPHKSNTRARIGDKVASALVEVPLGVFLAEQQPGTGNAVARSWIFSPSIRLVERPLTQNINTKTIDPSCRANTNTITTTPALAFVQNGASSEPVVRSSTSTAQLPLEPRTPNPKER